MNRAARTKLAKVLPLLGSDNAGERDAAALAASRILAKAGLSEQGLRLLWPNLRPIVVTHRYGGRA